MYLLINKENLATETGTNSIKMEESYNSSTAEKKKTQELQKLHRKY